MRPLGVDATGDLAPGGGIGRVVGPGGGFCWRFEPVRLRRACFDPQRDDARFVESRVKVELLAARDGRKRYTGVLRRADGESIQMDVDNFSVSIRLAEISRARLAPL